MTLFNRRATVTVGPASGGAGKTFSGLRVVFRTEKNLESTANSGQIQIYNLSRESRSRFEAADQQVILKAGYGEDVKLILSGDVLKCETVKQGPDLITTIEVGDGSVALKEAHLDKTFPKNTPELDILKAASKVLGAKGIKEKAISVIDAAKQVVSGFAASGSAKKILDDMAAKNDFEWSIQNGELQFMSKAKPTNEPYYKVTPSTGLVGSPTKTDSGVRFQSLLLPELLPGRGILLEATFIKGTYRATKVTHVGDTHQGQFLTEIEGQSV